MKHDAFEVFGLWQPQHHGVVERLADAANEPHVALRIMKSLCDRALELVGGNMVRTGERDEEAVFGKQCGRPGVKVAVAAQGFCNFSPRFGEGRRVEDDEIVFGFVGAAEKIKNIRLSGFDRESIARRIGAEARRAFGAGFHSGNMGCPSFGAGEGEAALVGKAVQHGQPAREFSHDAVGFELIEVKTGCVAAERIDKKSHA